MKSCGIIVEYNPFHNGHKYHLDMAKNLSKADVIIAVMSGNFTQRGEPAIIDKWERVNTALDNGVDIILELPYVFSIQSASNFAKGAIDILKLAKVDSICFGSETNNLEELIEISNTSINVDYLKENLKNGNSFVKSYGLLSKTMMPNDILGVAYLKNIKNTNIKPISIKRTNHYHDLSINDISSASAIRNALFLKKDIKHTTPMADSLLKVETVRLNMYFSYIRNLLLTLDKNYLKSLFLFNEGIENHLYKQILISKDFDDFINKATSRRYTTSRIKRTLLQLINQIKKEDVASLEKINKIRVLGFNEKGRKYLSKLDNVASKFAQIQKGYKEIELKTTHSYCLYLSEKRRNELIKKEIGGPIYRKDN